MENHTHSGMSSKVQRYIVEIVGTNEAGNTTRAELHIRGLSEVRNEMSQFAARWALRGISFELTSHGADGMTIKSRDTVCHARKAQEGEGGWDV